MTALKWPRPGRFHIRDAILARRHSRFSHVFGQISDGKPSILLFFAKKCDGAKLAPSRGWRFRDVILTRRREQQIPPCARSFSIFDKKKTLLLEPPKVNPIHRVPHTGWQQGGIPEEGENRRTCTIRNFLHAFEVPSMTDYPLDAVSAAGPLCTHGKDKPGLGGP